MALSSRADQERLHVGNRLFGLGLYPSCSQFHFEVLTNNRVNDLTSSQTGSLDVSNHQIQSPERCW